jgi:voltage-gated potassium channel
MTTVGYGDRFPVTTQGRAMAAVLMLAGIAILGIVTASIAAWFIGQFTAVAEAVEEEASEGADREVELLAALRELSQRMERLESRLDDAVRYRDDARHAEAGVTGTEPALMRDDQSS